MPECPTSLEELEEIAKMLPLCRVTLYNQAKARIESGAAKSVSEAARQLADETGQKPESVRRMINMGRSELGIDSQLSTLTGTDKHRPYASSAGKTITPPSPRPEPETDEHDIKPDFTCPICNDKFDSEVWHCKTCDHHWPMERQECWNCHEESQTDHVPSVQILAEIEKKILESARAIASEKREAKRAEIIEKLESVEAIEAKAIDGVYDVIVIDPPWPMQKIERDVTPNQVLFDYPTMSEDELKSLHIPCADDCHVWLWTTHRFLPMALRLIDNWGMKYVCNFTWHKPGGFQPFGLPQYNCEFAIYARKGAPVFVDTKSFWVCFNAERKSHSEKPELFYEMIRRTTAGRRLDMFNRRVIDGFEGWGKESVSE